jgi:hypothetical protein
MQIRVGSDIEAEDGVREWDRAIKRWQGVEQRLGK